MIAVTESWMERANQLDLTNRVNYSHYVQLMKEREDLPLNPSQELPDLPLKKAQKNWNSRVEYMAKLYYKLHTNPIVENYNTKRKNEGDIDRFLEEEKGFNYFFEDEVILLQEMKVPLDRLTEE